MRCLVFNTEEVEFVDTTPSDRPPGIHPRPSANQARSYAAVAVAFLCIEQDDTQADADRIAEELTKYHSMVGRRILVMPFVHLSSHPARPPVAIRLIRSVVTKLAPLSAGEDGGSFGYHKQMIAKLTTLAHKGSVAFRDSRYVEKERTEQETHNA